MNWLHYNPAAIHLPICGGCQEFARSLHTPTYIHIHAAKGLEHTSIWFIELQMKSLMWGIRDGSDEFLLLLKAYSLYRILPAIKEFQHFCIK